MSESRGDAPSTDLPVTPVQPQTMVEKVARAAFEADCLVHSHPVNWGRSAPGQERGFKTERAVWDAVARAAIEAMREPDEAMKAAGTERDDGADPTNAVGVYEAMIDAALAEQPAGCQP